MGDSYGRFHFRVFHRTGWCRSVLPRVSREGASSTGCGVHAADEEHLLYRPERIVGERLIESCHLGIMQVRNVARPREYLLVQFRPFARRRRMLGFRRHGRRNAGQSERRRRLDGDRVRDPTVRSHFGLCRFDFRSPLHPFVVPRVPKPLLVLKCAAREAVVREHGAQRRGRAHAHGQFGLNGETREVLPRERVWN